MGLRKAGRGPASGENPAPRSVMPWRVLTTVGRVLVRIVGRSRWWRGVVRADYQHDDQGDHTDDDKKAAQAPDNGAQGHGRPARFPRHFPRQLLLRRRRPDVDSRPRRKIDPAGVHQQVKVMHDAPVLEIPAASARTSGCSPYSSKRGNCSDRYVRKDSRRRRAVASAITRRTTRGASTPPRSRTPLPTWLRRWAAGRTDPFRRAGR